MRTKRTDVSFFFCAKKEQSKKKKKDKKGKNCTEKTHAHTKE